MRRELKCVGKHINRLYFHERYDRTKRHIQRHLEVRCKYVGKSIRSADFGFFHPDEHFIAALKLILEIRTSLKVLFSNTDEFNLNLDLHISNNV